jgi:hypothetical protein
MTYPPPLPTPAPPPRRASQPRPGNENDAPITPKASRDRGVHPHATTKSPTPATWSLPRPEHHGPDRPQARIMTAHQVPTAFHTGIHRRSSSASHQRKQRDDSARVDLHRRLAAAQQHTTTLPGTRTHGQSAFTEEIMSGGRGAAPIQIGRKPHPTPPNVDQHHRPRSAPAVPTIKALTGVLPAALHQQPSAA